MAMLTYLEFLAHDCFLSLMYYVRRFLVIVSSIRQYTTFVLKYTLFRRSKSVHYLTNLLVLDDIYLRREVKGLRCLRGGELGFYNFFLAETKTYT
jgi:hypothetical protein